MKLFIFITCILFLSLLCPQLKAADSTSRDTTVNYTPNDNGDGPVTISTEALILFELIPVGLSAIAGCGITVIFIIVLFILFLSSGISDERRNKVLKALKITFVVIMSIISAYCGIVIMNVGNGSNIARVSMLGGLMGLIPGLLISYLIFRFFVWSIGGVCRWWNALYIA